MSGVSLGRRMLKIFKNISVSQSTRIALKRIEMENCLSVCVSYVYVYVSNSHSFESIGMKLGMHTSWDPVSDIV